MEWSASRCERDHDVEVGSVAHREERETPSLGPGSHMVHLLHLECCTCT